MRYITCTYDAHAAEILEILDEAILNSTALYPYKPRNDYKPRSLEIMAGL